MQIVSPFNHTKYGFISEQAKELSDDFIMKGELLLNRAKTQLELSAIINDIHKAVEIETSIFEFSLTYCLTNDYEAEYIYATYRDKFYDIVKNITDEKVKNVLLKEKIKNGELNLREISFLTPAQMHPDGWRCFIEKQKCIKERESNIKYSDAYKCYKCGESKSKISLIQTRSADEPMTMFITCLVCGNTKKS